VLGGFDHEGPSLYNIFPHGSTDKLPFVTMGSGSLAAMAVFENGWHKELGKQDAINLVHQAIRAGIYNDLGSGGNVDLCIITKDGADFRRTYEEANPRFYYRLKGYKFEPGTTAVLSSSVEIVSTLPLLLPHHLVQVPQLQVKVLSWLLSQAHHHHHLPLLLQPKQPQQPQQPRLHQPPVPYQNRLSLCWNCLKHLPNCDQPMTTTRRETTRREGREREKQDFVCLVYF